MIRVTIEKYPYGDKNKAESLYTIDIINDGTGNSEVGNYEIRISRTSRLAKVSRVKGFRRANGVLRLLSAALHASRLEKKTTRDDVIVVIRDYGKTLTDPLLPHDLAVLCQMHIKTLRHHLKNLVSDGAIEWAGTVDSEITLRSQS